MTNLPPTRKERRLKKRARQRFLTGSILTASVIIGGGLFAVNTVQQASYENPYDVLPKDITSYAAGSLLDLNGSDKAIEKFSSILKEKDNRADLNQFSSNLKKYAESVSKNDGLGAKYVEVSYGDKKKLYLFNYVSKNNVKDILEDANCKTNISEVFCKENTLLVNGWVVAGDTDYYNKDTIKDNNLTSNNDFLNQIGNHKNNAITLWDINSAKYKAFMPMNLGEVLPSKNFMTSRINFKDEITIDTEIFPQKDENHPMFSLNESTPNISDLPKNSVLAVGIQNASPLVNLMLKDKNSYINQSDTWKPLVQSLQEWGMKDKNQDLILGDYSSLSLNEGSVGNKVSGVLSLKKSSEEKVLDIMNKAAEKDPNIVLNYEILKKGESLNILSHSPINDGVLSSNETYKDLMGEQILDKNNVLSLFVDIDRLYDLIDSDHIVDEKNKDGIIMLNVNNIDGILNSHLVWKYDITDKNNENVKETER